MASDNLNATIYRKTCKHKNIETVNHHCSAACSAQYLHGITYNPGNPGLFANHKSCNFNALTLSFFKIERPGKNIIIMSISPFHHCNLPLTI